MKTKILFSTITLLAGSLLAATSPKDEVISAAKALAGKPNYSWHQTVAVPESSQFKPAPTDGKTEKDGYTQSALGFGPNNSDIFIKGTNAAVTSQDGGWQSLAELEADQQGFGGFIVGQIRDFKTPAAQVVDICTNLTEIKKDGDAYTSDLTASGVQDLMPFGRRGFGGGQAPAITGAKGSVKFWIKDGVLSKYETHLSGKMDFNGNDFDLERTTTVEIKDVGTTKVTVPDEAKKKL